MAGDLKGDDKKISTRKLHLSIPSKFLTLYRNLIGPTHRAVRIHQNGVSTSRSCKIILTNTESCKKYVWMCSNTLGSAALPSMVIPRYARGYP